MSMSNNMNIQLEDINKPAINAAHVGERDKIIKPEYIENVKYLSVFSDVNLNKKIQWHCKQVLNCQMRSNDLEPYLDFDTGVTGPIRYGEIVILVSTHTPYSRLRACYGDFSSVTFDEKFKELLAISRENMTFTIHNHPYGGGLSWVDICTLLNQPALAQQIVVTNHGRIFQMTKTQKFSSIKAFAEVKDIERQYPMGVNVKSCSKQYYQIQKNRTMAIEPKLHDLGLCYLTVG